VVLCRNLLIYIDVDHKGALFDTLEASLADDGVLVLGMTGERPAGPLGQVRADRQAPTGVSEGLMSLYQHARDGNAERLRDAMGSDSAAVRKRAAEFLGEVADHGDQPSIDVLLRAATGDEDAQVRGALSMRSADR